ncbi:hypothetical protein LTS10_012278 [Elasticomyces elasticus]|nr:hypothetical protein LTS10_012278 [Elasticomyces elasticus]
MASYMNSLTNQGFAGTGGYNPEESGRGDDDDRKRPSGRSYFPGDYEPDERPRKRTRGGGKSKIKDRCLHCEQDGHFWRYCINRCLHCYSRGHTASALKKGDGRECPVIRQQHPTWYDILSHDALTYDQLEADIRDRVLRELALSRPALSEEQELLKEVRELTIHETELLRRAQMAGQARAAAEARLAAFKRRHKTMPAAPRSQAPDRRLAPISEYRLTTSHRPEGHGPHGNGSVDMYARLDGSSNVGRAPPTGPRSAGSSLAWDGDEGRGGVRGAIRDGYYAR